MAPLSSNVPSKLADYYILPLSLPSLPSFQIEATHYLYLRPHEARIPSPTTPRSLFLVNVPFDSTAIHLKSLFSRCLGLPSGRIEEVRFIGTRREVLHGSNEEQARFALVSQVQDGKKNNKRKSGPAKESIEDTEGTRLPETWDRQILHSGSNAVVVFVDRASMEAVVKAAKRAKKDGEKIVWGKGLEAQLPSLGPERYLNHHKLRYPDKSLLLETVNNYMTVYADQEAARARKLARQRQVRDEEGFVTVTRGGRTGPARQQEAQEKLEKQTERQKGLEDFYRFQSREKRKERAGELIRKFEQDREKVRRMRERRGRFKPE
ncbi:Ribosomal RNA-processing protein 7 [Lambiella insularis]|nr:Ribosomal RNA-processing protein 7 [Lambiella insularis]